MPCWYPSHTRSTEPSPPSDGQQINPTFWRDGRTGRQSWWEWIRELTLVPEKVNHGEGIEKSRMPLALLLALPDLYTLFCRSLYPLHTYPGMQEVQRMMYGASIDFSSAPYFAHIFFCSPPGVFLNYSPFFWLCLGVFFFFSYLSIFTSIVCHRLSIPGEARVKKKRKNIIK